MEEEEEDVEEEEQAEAGEDGDMHGSMGAKQPDDTAAWQAGRRMRRPLDSPLDMNLRYAAAGASRTRRMLSAIQLCYACHFP